MPREVFDVLKKFIQNSNGQSLCSKTRFTHQTGINNEDKLQNLIIQLASIYYEDKDEESMKEEKLLQMKILCKGQRCKVLMSEDKPLSISYPMKRETIKITLHYGCWNINGILQHIL